MSSEDWKRQLVQMFFARLGVIVTVNLIVLAIAVAIAFLWAPTYRATASVMMRDKTPQPSIQSIEIAESRPVQASRQDLASELEIINAPELTMRTLICMSKIDNTESSRSISKENIWKEEKPTAQYPLYGIYRKLNQTLQDSVSVGLTPLAAQTRLIQERLETAVVPQSTVIRLQLASKDRKWAEQTLDGLLDNYLGYRNDVLYPGSQGSFYDDRASTYSERLTNLENQLGQLALDNKVGDIQEELKSIASLRATIREQRTLLVDERLEKEEMIAPIQKALESNDIQFFSFLDSAPVNLMAQELLQLTSKKGEIARVYADKSQNVQALTKNLEEVSGLMRKEVQRILESRQSEVDALTSRIAAIDRTIADITAESVRLQKNQIEYQRIQRDLTLVENSYSIFKKRSEEAGINKDISNANISGEVSILSRAETSATLLFPKKTVVIPLGLIVGFLVGFAIAFLIESLDHTVRWPEDVSRYTDLPILVSIRKV